MGISNVLELLGGVALFLFGMALMGDSLKKYRHGSVGSAAKRVLIQTMRNRHDPTALTNIGSHARPSPRTMPQQVSIIPHKKYGATTHHRRTMPVSMIWV